MVQGIEAGRWLTGWKLVPDSASRNHSPINQARREVLLLSGSKVKFASRQRILPDDDGPAPGSNEWSGVRRAMRAPRVMEGPTEAERKPRPYARRTR